MAKTKEELDALKNKVKDIKSEIMALSKEELSMVAGGDDDTDCTKQVHCPKCGSTKISCEFDGEKCYCICRSCGYQWD